MQKLQAEANATSGPRYLPAKTIPVPPDLDPEMATAVAAPYSPLWGMDAADDNGWRALVKAFDEARIAPLEPLRTHLRVSITVHPMGGIQAFMLKPAQVTPERQGRLIIHLHGGGFMLGNGEAGTFEATLLAGFSGYEVLSVDYRMLPDHPFPAGVDDAVALWAALVGAIDPGRIAIHGTSAGANIALAFLLRARALNLPMPAALALGSPPTDFTAGGDSNRTNEWLDNVLVSRDGPYLRYGLGRYPGGRDLADPMISPLFADLSGMPPTVLISGTRDLFLSDTVRLHRKLRKTGIDADLHVYEAVSHSSFLLAPLSETSRDMYREVTGFFETRYRP